MRRFINYFKKQNADNTEKNIVRKRSNFPSYERHDVVISVTVSDGVDWGIAGYIPGRLISELDDVLEKISDYLDEDRK